MTHALAHAGHRVTILESARILGDVGADIQLSRNSRATTWLLCWRLSPAITAYGVKPTAIVFRRYGTCEPLGYKRSVPHTARDHDALYCKIYRLACTAPGMCICLGTTVRDVQRGSAVADGLSVRLASGGVLYAGLVVAADGVKSTTEISSRASTTGPSRQVTLHIGWSYPDLMLQDPELSPFVETAEAAVWIAPCYRLVHRDYRQCDRESVCSQRSENVLDL